MADIIKADFDLKICGSCGTQFGTENLPDVCPVCLDERHFVPAEGQIWTSLRELHAQEYSIEFREDKTDPDVSFLVTKPTFAIGQSPILIKTASGYMMLECCGFVTADAVAHIEALVKVSGLPFVGIIISHPHWYNSSTTWARALRCKVYAHALDKEWWLRSDSFDDVVYWWTGKTLKISDHATMIHCGGHFAGSCVTHIVRPGKSGFLGAGDTIMIAHNRRQVSFMYSYSNWVPLKPEEVASIWNTVSEYSWADAYGPWPPRNIIGKARDVILDGVKKFLTSEGWSETAFKLNE